MVESVLGRLVALAARVPRIRAVFYALFLDWLDWPKPLSSRMRAYYWRARMRSLGSGTRISHKVKIQSPENVSIGKQTHITNNSILNAKGGISIGDYVLIGYESIVTTSMRKYKDPNIPIQFQGSERKAVVIGDDVWLGARVIVLPGVALGNGAVVGSGAVVTKDVPPYSIVAGVPARVIGQREKSS